MAGEVVEIVSSDDEFEERRPIGWNYQGITKNKLKSQTHGRPRPKFPRNSEDDVLIVELTPEKVPPSIANEVPVTESNQNGYHSNGQKVSKSLREPLNSVGTGHGKHGPLPKIKSRHGMPNSCSRQEIKALTRNTTQSTMSKFLKVVDNKRKQPDDEDMPHQEKKKIKLILINTDSTKAQNRTVKPIIKSEEKLFKSSSGPSRNDKTIAAVTKMDSGADVPDFALRGSEDPPGHLEDDTTEKSKGALTSFIIRWKAIKASIDKNDRKIEDKIWKYFYLAHSSFTHSKKFLSNVELATSRMTLDNIYVLIKDLLDSLKSYKDVPYKEIKQRSLDGAGPSTEQPAEPLTEEEKKREKKLKKIERMMKKISEKIQELDEAEVDLEDEDNSAYLVQERLKAQFMKLDDFYCKLAQCSRSTGRPVERKFKYEGSRYAEINQRITAWINKHREFPDYQDVLNLVKKVTNDSLLPLRPETVRVQAQEIFRDVGRELKERREHDDLYSIYSYAAPDLPPDPAIKDPDLAARLNNNAELAQDKLSKVFQKFVDKETEQREATDKKIAATDETKVKTSSDDEPTEKESKDSDAPLKDSDETTRDSDDTGKDGADLSNDTNNEDTMDGVEEPEQDPAPLDRGDQPEKQDVVREDQLNNHDIRKPTRKSNDSPDVLPFHQEELVFQDSAVTTKNPAYDVDQPGHNDTEEPDDLVFDDGPRNQGDEEEDDEHDMYDDHCDVEEQDSDAADMIEQIDDGDEDEEMSEVTTLPDIEGKKIEDGASNCSEDSAVQRALDDHIEELMAQRSELELDDEEEEDEEVEGNEDKVLEVMEKMSEEASDVASRSCVEKTPEHSTQMGTSTVVEDKAKDCAMEFDTHCKGFDARTSIEIIEDEVDYAVPEASKASPALTNAVNGTEENSFEPICEDNQMDCSEEDETNLNKENRTPDKVTNSMVRFNANSTIVDRLNISENELNNDSSLSSARTVHLESATIERKSSSPQKKELSHLIGQDSISGLNVKSVKYSPSKPVQSGMTHDSSTRHHSPSGRLSSPATKRKLISQATSSENIISLPVKLAHQDHRVVPNRLSPQKQSVAPNCIESDKSVIHLRSPDRGTTTITRISLSPSNRQPNDLLPRVNPTVEEVISEDDDIQCLPSPDHDESWSPSKAGSVVTSLVRVNARRGGKLSVSRGIAMDCSPPRYSGSQTSPASQYQSPSLPRYNNSSQVQQPSPSGAGIASPPPARHRSPSAAGYGSPPLVKHRSPSAAGYRSPPVRNQSPSTAGNGSPPTPRRQSPSAVGYGSPTPARHRSPAAAGVCSPPLTKHQSPSAVEVGSPPPVGHQSPAMAEVVSPPPPEHRSSYAGYRSPPPVRRLSPPDKSARLIIIGSPTKTYLEGQRGSRNDHSAPPPCGRSTDRSPPCSSPSKSPKGPHRAAVAGSPQAVVSLTPDKSLNAKSSEQNDVPEVLPSGHDSSEEDVQLADSASDDEGSVTIFRAVTTPGGPDRASKRPHPATPSQKTTVTCSPVIAGAAGDKGRQSPDARFNGGHYRRYDGSSSPELVELE